MLEGRFIFLQLWHVGRISHSSLLNGRLPVVSLAINAVGDAFISSFERVHFQLPRALDKKEINQIIEDYRVAARNAQRTAFDGVEIHAANGYLLEYFFGFEVINAMMNTVERLRIGVGLFWKLHKL